MLRAQSVIAAIVVLHFAFVRVIADPGERGTVLPANTVVLSQQAPMPIETTQETQSADQTLLERKLIELNRLQNEVEQLRAATGTPKQILVKAQVLELSRSKMR